MSFFRSRTRRPAHGLVSVVIPCEPESRAVEALDALAALPARERALLRDVHVAQGRNPGRQRNLAARRAQGEWLWFLDKDARPEPGCLAALLARGEAQGAAAMGGPDLGPGGESALGRRFDAVLGSWFGGLASRARYRAVGAARACAEKELIGCNLLVRRSAFFKVQGFREDLYPNEENELLERLRLGGGLLWYEPAAAVRRRRPDGLGEFAAKAFAYGQGRARQARLAWTRGSLANFLPLLLPLAWFFAGLGTAVPWGAGGRFLELPLAAYGLAVGCAAMLGRRFPFSSGPLFVLRHHAYALGLLSGLLRPLPVFSLEVQVRRVDFAKQNLKPKAGGLRSCS